MEIWKDIEGYEGLYQISDKGRIKSLQRISKFGKNKKILKERIMTQKVTRFGYHTIRLSKNGKKNDYSVHRLVAKAFIENTNNLPQVNHKDENKDNNCIENLEWCSSSYNINYGNRNRKVSKKISQKVAKLGLDGKVIKIYNSMTEAQEENDIWHSGIGLCCRKLRETAGGFKWEYVYDT